MKAMLQTNGIPQTGSRFVSEYSANRFTMT